MLTLSGPPEQGRMYGRSSTLHGLEPVYLPHNLLPLMQ